MARPSDVGGRSDVGLPGPRWCKTPVRVQPSSAGPESYVLQPWEYVNTYIYVKEENMHLPSTYSYIQL